MHSDSDHSLNYSHKVITVITVYDLYIYNIRNAVIKREFWILPYFEK